MNEEELEQEWAYRYQERLGIMCGTETPTPEQLVIAMQEADTAIEQLKITCS